MTVRSPRTLSIYVLKRSIFVLTASGSARREFTVSALTRFSSGARKRTYGFLRKEKRRASSGGMSAVALYLEF